MTPSIEWIRPGVGFTSAAAASFRRAEADWGRLIDSNSTHRDYAKQLSMWRAWQAYVAGTGPHPGHSRALHPDKSKHCLGEALDSDDWATPGFIAFMEERGWIRTAANDPTERHHFEYQWWRDQHRNRPASGGSAELPITEPAVPEEEDEDMKLKGASYKRAEDGETVFILFNEVSGFYSEHSGVGGDYNNPLAQNWDTGSWPGITESHASALKRNLDKVRARAL